MIYDVSPHTSVSVDRSLVAKFVSITEVMGVMAISLHGGTAEPYSHLLQWSSIRLPRLGYPTPSTWVLGDGHMEWIVWLQGGEKVLATSDELRIHLGAHDQEVPEFLLENQDY